MSARSAPRRDRLGRHEAHLRNGGPRSVLRTDTLRRLFDRILVVTLATPAVALGAVGACGDGSPGATSTRVDGGGGSGAGVTDPDGGTSAAGMATGAGGSADPCASRLIVPDASDDGGFCSDFLELPCGLPAGATLDSQCYVDFNDCQTICDLEVVFNCHAYGSWCDDAGVHEAGPYVVECVTCPNGVGRRPRGLAPARTRRRGSRVGEHFALAAHLEAASVHAFRILRAELCEHGAPRSLIDAAAHAALDEVRHARRMTRLAARYGAKPAKVVVSRRARRSLEAVALENATEGCVNETFGALVAAWQARRAQDARVAAVMADIAADEARHAAVSWAVARWADAELAGAARSRVRREIVRAARALVRDEGEPNEELRNVAGLPNRAERAALAREFLRRLPHIATVPVA